MPLVAGCLGMLDQRFHVLRHCRCYRKARVEEALKPLQELLRIRFGGCVHRHACWRPQALWFSPLASRSVASQLARVAVAWRRRSGPWSQTGLVVTPRCQRIRPITAASSLSAIRRRRRPRRGQASTSNLNVRSIRDARHWPRAWRRAVSVGSASRACSVADSSNPESLPSPDTRRPSITIRISPITSSCAKTSSARRRSTPQRGFRAGSPCKPSCCNACGSRGSTR
jgi:hypothetical protein